MTKINHLSGLGVLVLLCALIFGTAQPASAADATQAAAPQATAAAAPASTDSNGALYSARGAATCMKCHDQSPITDVLQTPHGTKGDPRSPFGQHECESCHGPSEAHVESAPAPGQKKTEPAVVFNGPNASPVSSRNEVCLSCHQNGLRMDWAGSQHQDNNLACTSCHTIHVKKDPILVKATQPEKCFSCHAEQRALTLQFSHHPIREGKVACSDCHNPHGSPNRDLLKKARVTDLCYSCHADKRGPMLWEHQPVREDCTNCHNPHGSVNPRLLKEKVPFLCLDCHAATNDMGGVGVSKQSVAAHSGSLYLYGDRSCLNCHSQIHGSDSPSGSTFFR
ncbi:MAG: DmsE family decaheme c-type cytochrome [Alphaproteobacteria bacterium]|nr:DmsE family decaheme c-type cytochrome [Alphaproteobacteria bacterium]MDE2163418.1 DmsE family decaheme c-type cytochrome [Alphaproteobacteria bacterium]